MKILLNANDTAYVAECLQCYRRRVPNATEAQYKAFVEKVQLRMGCWEVIYRFRMQNYPVLNVLNAAHIA